MTNDEYRQLIEFLTGKFGEIESGFALVSTHFAEVDRRFAEVDRRFAQVDVRFVQVDAQFVAMHREIGEVRQELLAEIDRQGDRIDGNLADFRQEVRAGLDEVKGLFRLGYGDLDRRVRRLEDRG